MGYEIKLHFGEIGARSATEPAAYFAEVGRIDLCCIGGGQTEQLDSTDTGNVVYLYASNGNDRIYTDEYGRVMRVHPVKDVLNALRADHKRDPYRRYAIAIAALAEASKYFKNLFVVFYGH